MANRYTVVIWQTDFGFHAVVPALGMAPVVGETRQMALDLCRDVALDRLATATAAGVPMPHDVKVNTDHLTVRDDGQVRNVASEFVPLLNAAMGQATLQVAGNPAAVKLLVDWFSELITTLRETDAEVSPLLAGIPLATILWTPARIIDMSDDILVESIAELELPSEEGEQLRGIVRQALEDELRHVPKLQHGFHTLDPFGGPLGGLFGPFDDPLDDPDAFNPFIVEVPPEPPKLGPMQHPPGRKNRKRS